MPDDAFIDVVSTVVVVQSRVRGECLFEHRVAERVELRHVTLRGRVAFGRLRQPQRRADREQKQTCLASRPEGAVRQTSVERLLGKADLLRLDVQVDEGRQFGGRRSSRIELRGALLKHRETLLRHLANRVRRRRTELPQTQCSQVTAGLEAVGRGSRERLSLEQQRENDQ